MHVRYFLALAGVICLALIPSVRADDTGKRNTVNELIQLFEFDKTIESMNVEILRQIETDMRQQFPDVDDTTLAAAASIVREETAPMDGRLVEYVGDLMARYYTEKELRDVLAFYKSETGRKSIKLMPKISEETGKLVREWGMPMQKRIDFRLSDLLREKGYK